MQTSKKNMIKKEKKKKEFTISNNAQKQNKTKKLKVVWIVHGNHPIHTGISQELGKKCELYAVMRKRHEKDKFPDSNYNILYLQEKEKVFEWLLLPSKLKNIFSKTKQELPPMLYFGGLKKELKRIKPDVVVSNICYMPATWQAALYCKKTKTPFVIQTEIQRYPEYTSGKVFAKLIMSLRFVFNQATLILPWTKDGIVFGKANFGKKNKDKIKLLSPGVDTAEFNNRHLSKDKKLFNIIQVARMIPYKRQTDLIEAVFILKKKGIKNIRVLLLGKGYYTDTLKEIIKNKNLEKEIQVVGRIEDIVEEYCKRDLLVLPSYNEAVGMVVPEAMVCGIPAIVTDTCGANTYITEGKTGFIIKTKDYKTLAKRIEFLVKNRNKCEEMSRNAEKYILENHTLAKTAEKFYELIQEAKQKYDEKRKNKND